MHILSMVGWQSANCGARVFDLVLTAKSYQIQMTDNCSWSVGLIPCGLCLLFSFRNQELLLQQTEAGGMHGQWAQVCHAFVPLLHSLCPGSDEDTPRRLLSPESITHLEVFSRLLVLVSELTAELLEGGTRGSLRSLYYSMLTSDFLFVLKQQTEDKEKVSRNFSYTPSALTYLQDNKDGLGSSSR